MFQVINVETGESHGRYGSIEEARGCIIFDGITDWEIWDSDGHFVSSGQS